MRDGSRLAVQNNSCSTWIAFSCFVKQWAERFNVPINSLNHSLSSVVVPDAIFIKQLSRVYCVTLAIPLPLNPSP